MLLFNPQNNTCFSIFRRYVAGFDALCVFVWLLVRFLTLFSMFCSQERLSPAASVVCCFGLHDTEEEQPQTQLCLFNTQWEIEPSYRSKTGGLVFLKMGNWREVPESDAFMYIDPILFPLHIISAFAARWRVSATSILGFPRLRILEIRE